MSGTNIAVGEMCYLGELPSGDDWHLATDSHDIEAYVGVVPQEALEDASGVYSLMGDGEFLEIWVTTYRNPWDLNSMYRRVS